MARPMSIHDLELAKRTGSLGLVARIAFGQERPEPSRHPLVIKPDPRVRPLPPVYNRREGME